MFYQKYRPQLISELDSVRIRETLGKSLLEDKFSHAYLLTGPRGIGKTTTARLIAKIVNCSDRKTGKEPCRKCDSCKSIEAGNALDIIEIDAASNRGIDEIRTLREGVKLAPSSLKYKVYIIDEVHMLTTEAFNALLKTLEEPPSHVIFILATTDAAKVPETVSSRCQNFQFSLSTIAETVHSLERVVGGEGLVVDEKVLTEIAKIAKGSFRDATKILEQLANYSKEITEESLEKVVGGMSGKQAEEIINCLAKNDKDQALEILDECVSSGKRVKDLMVGLISSLRDMLLQHSSTLTEKQINDLLEKLFIAFEQMNVSPIAQLPLEMVIVNTVILANEERARPGSLKVNDERDSGQARMTTGHDVLWERILLNLKPYSSIFALLKAARGVGLDGDIYTIEVLYKFHKDKLEESKNHAIIEKVVSDIIGIGVKVRFILVSK